MPHVVDVAAIPTLNELSRQGEFLLPQGVTPPVPGLGDRVSIYLGDITQLKIDAIVNAANGSLSPEGGVNGQIHLKAGPELARACKAFDHCRSGSAKITDGFDLPCKKVIHVVGPRFSFVEPDVSKRTLQSCIFAALDLATENDCKSVAVCAIKSASDDYPVHLAIGHVFEAVRIWMLKDGKKSGAVERVVFCVYAASLFDLYLKLIAPYFGSTKDDNLTTGKTADLRSDQIASAEAKVTGQPSPVGGSTTAAVASESDQHRHTVSKEMDDWIKVDKSEYSDINGHVNDMDDRRSTSIDEHDMTQEEKEQVALSLHLAEHGADPMRSLLERDW